MTGFQTDVRVDAAPLLRRLKNARGQIPFALKTALNDIAEDVRLAEIVELQRKFTVRGTWWKPRRRYGFNVNAASKRNLKAEIFTRAYWMFDHATGGTRSEFSKRRAIPQTDRIRRTRSGAVSKPWRPRNIANRFAIELNSGHGILFKWDRRKKTKEKMYFLIPSARIDKKFEWDRVGQQTAKKKAPKHMRNAVRRALRTAR